MNALVLGVAALLCVSAVAAAPQQEESCGGARGRAAMAHVLYDYRNEEGDFRGYICGDAPCTEQAFSEELEYEQSTLRDDPLALGCFVRPAHSATSSIHALFLWHGSSPQMNLVTLGVGLGVAPESRGGGYRDLISTKRDGDEWTHERWVWNGRRYLESDKTLHPPPLANLAPACLELGTRSAIALALYARAAFREVVCDDPACSERDFDEQVSFRQVALRNEPPLTGCFVEPVERSDQSLTWLFALEPAGPSLLLTYSGKGMRADLDHRDHGYARLVGSRLQGKSTLQHQYRWTGRKYALASESPRSRSDR